ncbi:MAG: Crp/Fnr family transcriptional regulator [Actinomycetota bacterium]
MSVHQTCRFHDRCQLNKSMGDGPCCRFAGRMTLARAARKGFLFHEGDPVKGAFILLTGILAMERLTERGDLVIVRLVRPGELFPYVDPTAAEAHASTARALGDVTACFLSGERLAEAMREAPRFSLAMVRLGSTLMRQSEDSVMRLCSSEFSDLVVAELEALALHLGRRNPDGDWVFTLPMPWRDFAALVGITPESLSRLLKRLGKAGRIQVRGHEVTIAPAAEGCAPWVAQSAGARSLAG